MAGAAGFGNAAQSFALRVRIVGYASPFRQMELRNPQGIQIGSHGIGSHDALTVAHGDRQDNSAIGRKVEVIPGKGEDHRGPDRRNGRAHPHRARAVAHGSGIRSVGADSAGGLTALMPSSGMFPPIAILTARASSAREPISRFSFASSSRTCSALLRQTRDSAARGLDGRPRSGRCSLASAETRTPRRRWPRAHRRSSRLPPG
jgi:hypothetical protein